MVAKMSIDLSQGLLEVEGDDGFIKSVYDDFKAVVLSKFEVHHLIEKNKSIEQQSDLDGVGNEMPLKAKNKKRRNSTPRKTEGNQAVYRPKIDQSLKIEKLKEFYDSFDGPNQSENILIFCKYIESVSGKIEFSADEIFTCYTALRIPLPKDIRQALRNAKAKQNGFIDFSGTEDIRITNIGLNHYNLRIKRKPVDAVE